MNNLSFKRSPKQRNRRIVALMAATIVAGYRANPAFIPGKGKSSSDVAEMAIDDARAILRQLAREASEREASFMDSSITMTSQHHPLTPDQTNPA